MIPHIIHAANFSRRVALKPANMNLDPQGHSSTGAKPLRISRSWPVLMILLLVVAVMCPIRLCAQGPVSPRLSINLAAGVPQYIGNSSTTSTAPQSNWWVENKQGHGYSTSTNALYTSKTFVESTDTS